MSRYTNKEPKIVWFIKQNDGWYAGPFVNKPRQKESIPYLLTQITDKEVKQLLKK